MADRAQDLDTAWLPPLASLDTSPILARACLPPLPRSSFWGGRAEPLLPALSILPLTLAQSLSLARRGWLAELRGHRCSTAPSHRSCGRTTASSSVFPCPSSVLMAVHRRCHVRRCRAAGSHCRWVARPLRPSCAPAGEHARVWAKPWHPSTAAHRRRCLCCRPNRPPPIQLHVM
jgi:hypothetical protein